MKLYNFRGELTGVSARAETTLPVYGLSSGDYICKNNWTDYIGVCLYFSQRCIRKRVFAGPHQFVYSERVRYIRVCLYFCQRCLRKGVFAGPHQQGMDTFPPQLDSIDSTDEQ